MLKSWQRAVPFVKGESGNPAGRPPGSRNTRTLLCEAFLENQSEGLTRTLVNLANRGDGTALRLAIDRILPRGASRPILFALPRVDSATAARPAVADAIQGMATAQLAPREGNEFLRVIEHGAKIIATAEAVAREWQPRHIQVSWVDRKDFKVKWKACWKEQYEALYGPLPDLPEPEDDDWLPPEKAPAADKPGAVADRESAPADPAGTPPAPSPAVAEDGARNNENNGNNKNATDAVWPAAGDPAPSAGMTGARRPDGDPPLPPSASPEGEVGHTTTKTMKTTKIQRTGRGRGGGPAAAVARRAPGGR